MNPMDVLAPNIMDSSLSNSGLDGLIVNTGWGVPEIDTSQKEDQEEPMAAKRRASARQFGQSMERVGF